MKLKLSEFLHADVPFYHLGHNAFGRPSDLSDINPAEIESFNLQSVADQLFSCKKVNNGHSLELAYSELGERFAPIVGLAPNDSHIAIKAEQYRNIIPPYPVSSYEFTDSIGQVFCVLWVRFQEEATILSGEDVTDIVYILAENDMNLFPHQGRYLLDTIGCTSSVGAW